jgi:hypothetical protein
MDFALDSPQVGLYFAVGQRLHTMPTQTLANRPSQASVGFSPKPQRRDPGSAGPQTINPTHTATQNPQNQGKHRKKK